MNNAQAQQFAALQKATTTYSNETKTADHMRRREVDLMNREQDQQRRLEEELRVAHGALGEETRTQKNLEIERDREGTETDEKAQEIQFVKEMESLTNESDYLLAQRENSKTSGLLDAEHVKWLIESKLDALVNRNDGVEAAENEKWSDVSTRVKEELAGMVEDDAKEEEARKQNNELEQFLQQLRAKVLSDNSNWGQLEIEDIENKWDQHSNYQEDQGENAMEVDGSKQQEPVHMGLFYNNQEYGNGAAHDTNSANNTGYGV